MRSPPPYLIPKVIHQSPAGNDDDDLSIASSSSLNTNSSRTSRIQKNASFSTFGFGNEAKIRVVARIRNDENAQSEGTGRVRIQTCDDLKTVSFLSPSNEKSQVSFASPTPSTGTVSGLAAKFENAEDKPLMPCALNQNVFSPSQGKTPLRANGIKPVRQSFIQTPTPKKEIEEKIEKKVASQFQTSQTVIAGNERFVFDNVSNIQ